MPKRQGTPVITLGFTREELEAMDGRAFPDRIEAWVHGLVTAALVGSVVYEHRFADEPEGDASRGGTNPLLADCDPEKGRHVECIHAKRLIHQGIEIKDQI